MEVWERFKNHQIKDFTEFTWFVKIIETALKRSEEKEHNCEVYLKQMNGLVSKLAKYEKEHKALEIIKEYDIKPSEFMLFAKDSNYEHYYECWSGRVGNEDLTKEQFDLLKEVLK